MQHLRAIQPPIPALLPVLLLGFCYYAVARQYNTSLSRESRRASNTNYCNSYYFSLLLYLQFSMMSASPLVDDTVVNAVQPEEVQPQHFDNKLKRIQGKASSVKSSSATSTSSTTTKNQNPPSKPAAAGSAPARKTTHDKDRQLALARASAARKRAAKERGEITREPAAKGLILPYRAIRRIMKLDKDNSTIQIEAAIIATKAAELFVQKMAKESHKHAKGHGRNGIKYEDIAETRASNPNMSFLDVLLP
jgi:histone H3/H4